MADLLDKRGVFRARLFREACVFHKGNYVKDLGRLGRDLKKVRCCHSFHSCLLSQNLETVHVARAFSLRVYDLFHGDESSFGRC